MGGSRRALKRVLMGDRGNNMRKMMRIYEENKFKRMLLILTTGFPTVLLLLLLRLLLLLAVLLLFLRNGDGVVDCVCTSLI